MGLRTSVAEPSLVGSIFCWARTPLEACLPRIASTIESVKKLGKILRRGQDSLTSSFVISKSSFRLLLTKGVVKSVTSVVGTSGGLNW